MELLLDNLRNVLFKGKHGKIKEFSLPDKRFLVNIAIIISLSVLVARSALNYSIDSVLIAFLTVLMLRSRTGLYALPFIFIGMSGAAGRYYNPIHEAAMLFLCLIVYLLPVSKKLPLYLRALISAVIMVFVKISYFLWSGLLFLYDGKAISFDLLILFGTIYIFHEFFCFLDKGLEVEIDPVVMAIVVPAVVLIAAGGITTSQVVSVSILHVIAFFVVLILGYGMGPGIGGTAGIFSGFMIMLMAYETPALAGILGCCGIVSGFFFGKRRLLAGICFAGMALAFGLFKGFPNLYISIYEPIIASLTFILIPKGIMDRMMKYFSVMRQDDTYYEWATRKKAKEEIAQYADLFAKLSLASGSMRPYYPSRDIVSQQFKGMSRALHKIAIEVSKEHGPIKISKPRYTLKTATAGYAKEGRISGDSCLCSPLNDKEFLLALSDGMGQGLKASEESSFTVTTLFNLVKAGFEVELALKMVNSILLQKPNDEILSTLDMGLINLCTGRARIFKIGAAAGFIKRGDNVRMIKMAALPLGIIERVPIECISVRLKRDDMLIIVSDGISDAERSDLGAEWVKDVISEVKSTDPQTMADLIINRAVQKYGLREKDDMTVMTALIQ